ncbi:Hypothetical protein CINCED_3A011678 [Cinara cedri]|uniref:Alpha-1,6-mannosyl-glycoprotein 2-beta-N-acetylglucosaminyltransferase n=1 Tax=Cinara cedri TaxID=506608 RepID=A0A5E4M0Y1_9HEMI|nr:Hypothetical protein CINCED_3A011678 [Cinara cedri]
MEAEENRDVAVSADDSRVRSAVDLHCVRGFYVRSKQSQNDDRRGAGGTPENRRRVPEAGHRHVPAYTCPTCPTTRRYKYWPSRTGCWTPTIPCCNWFRSVCTSTWSRYPSAIVPIRPFCPVVFNEDVYGPLQNDSLVIVIQVHTRIMYLRHTIVSLARARGIENALLIFSHDHYDEQINELIQMIDFCKTMQIFYPYSIQTHPDSFPGESPDDCPRDIPKSEAIKRKCINAMHPDQYGHYREAKFTQTKHHWWWKANRVFNELDVVNNYSGPILFLEDDHYVAEDFIYMLKLMEKSCSIVCPQCSILSLGTYLKTYNFYGEAKAEISQWISSKHNMGMAYNRTVWKQIVKCAGTFCKYDDYNWDWSLQGVSNNCLSHEFKVFVLKAPRVFHIGECGVHHKKSCFDMALIAKVQKLLSSVYKYLYPDKLEVTYAPIKKKVLRKGNGGWGDVRDHELCMRMVNHQW